LRPQVSQSQEEKANYLGQLLLLTTLFQKNKIVQVYVITTSLEDSLGPAFSFCGCFFGKRVTYKGKHF